MRIIVEGPAGGRISDAREVAKQVENALLASPDFRGANIVNRDELPADEDDIVGYAGFVLYILSRVGSG